MDTERSHRAPRWNPLPITRTGSTLNPSPIDSSALCLRCGYELRGLSPSGLCPECGFSIAESLEKRRLGLSSPAYLASLRLGALLAIIALTIYIAAGFVRWHLVEVFFAPGTQKYFVILDIAGATLLVFGVWKLTIDDPGLHIKDQARANKRAMRCAAAGLLLLVIIELLVALRTPLPTIAIGVSPAALSLSALIMILAGALWNLACWLMLATGLVNYTRWLAVRVPDQRLLSMAKTMGWLLPAAIAGAFVASLFFGSATRLLPLGLMAWLVGAARERIRTVGNA
ncbi:MAG: hypothetical protein KF805_07415 [Phycisphaeraceae bacterium]|nr:hypothetical protein [Phycisphaeraceae bacterium]